MSAIPRSSSSFAVSDKLLAPLREVSRRQWYFTAAVGGLQTLAVGLLALLGGAMLLAEFGGLPGFLRLPIAAITWGLVVWAAIRFLRPALRRWSPGESALQIERQLPGVHERLSSAVELAAEPDDRFRGSSSLIAFLFHQAETDADKIKPQLIVRPDRVKRWAILLAPVLLAWLLLAILRPRPLGAGLYRLFRPLDDQLPAMLSQIAVTPGDVTLAQGDDLDVAAKVSANASAKDKSPDGALLATRFGDGPATTAAMSTLSTGQFKLTLANVQQTFQYQVTGGSASSGWYTATVHPRPAVSSLDVRYDFPPYTGLESKIAKAGDGTIEGLVGAKVTLTIHATGPLIDTGDNKNQLLLDESRQSRTTVPITPLSGNDYQASFILSHSGQYRIQLCNAYGLTNKDDQLRNIIAHFDQPPTIVIQSPAASETVRPDDDVPVRYIATDDFAVASISAIVAADDSPPQEHVIHLGPGDRKLIRGTYVLSVQTIAAQNNLSEINRITYQLQATDNRDPDPQSALTPKQTLIIDRNSRSYGEKEDERRVHELNRAIEQAVQHLNEAEGKSGPLRNGDPNHPLSEEEKRLAREAQQQLDDANQELHDAADAQQQTPFAAVGKKADEIADQSVQQAAEHTAKAQLAEDNPQQRAEEANQAQQQIAQARDRLGQLRNEVEQARQKAEAARDLQQAAKLQAEAAKGLADSPEKASQNQEKQRQAMQKLQEAMQKEPALRDAAAQQVAQHLADLANHIQDVQNQQTRQQQQTAKQQQLAQTQDQSNKLAEQQKKLNDEIQHFAQSAKKPLDASHAQLPNADQQNNIVAALNRNDADNAAAQMRQQDEQLKQANRQLRQQADRHDPDLTPDQQAKAQQDQQADQSARQQQDQANQAAGELAQDAQHPQAPAPDDAAEQHVAQAAKAIQQQADALHPADATAQKDAQAADHDAQQAGQHAQSAEHAANLHDAQNDLTQAGHELQQAAHELARAAHENADADQAEARAEDRHEAGDAAQEARQLEQEQQQLSRAVEAHAPPVARARDGAEPRDQAAQEQRQLADQAQQAAHEAQALAQQAGQSPDADVAHRAAAAQQALQQAAGEQQQASGAEQQGDADHAAEHQQAAQQDLAQAQSALRGLDNPPAADAQADSGQAPPADHGNQTAAQRAEEAAAVQPQALQPNPQAAQEAANALAQAAAANAQPEPGKPDEGKTSGQEPGQATDLPMPALISAQGVSAQEGNGTGRPEAVRALGISAADWARLPTLLRGELMNAAQQSGPPAYREMIKNYYVRIAREQTEAGSEQQ